MSEKINLEEEKQLIAAILAGSPEAGDAFVKKYSQLVYNTINRTLRGKSWTLQPEAIDDLHQGVFQALLDPQ